MMVQLKIKHKRKIFVYIYVFMYMLPKVGQTVNKRLKGTGNAGHYF